MSTLHVVRKGHIGDVIITEPVVRVLKRQFNRALLYTHYIEAGRLLEIYDDVLPYDLKPAEVTRPGDAIFNPLYEVFPGANHLDGYARAAGVTLEDRLPRVKSGWPRIGSGRYGLIAPETSNWMRDMRQWPLERFTELKSRLQAALGFAFVLLGPSHSFCDMLSLIEHCDLFVGNDSAPAILAQSWRRPAFVICGSTRAMRVLLDPSAVGIEHEVGCNGCKDFARHTDIGCASPICLTELTVDKVHAVIMEKFRAIG
ncbi:MAG TPA: glycosyltransferase family 9 protein [Rhizomicrobium sp.]|nr:glycosyltransferase family 9 protein [Rhizomicrobium sp.]